MRSRRTLAVVITLGAIVLVGVVVSVVIFSRDDGVPANGDLIAYSCKERHNPWYAICISKSDGSERRRTTTRIQTSTPAWSPDGRKIAFTRNEDIGEYTTFSDDDLFVMDADGSDLEQLTPERDGVHSGQPAWSPDGRRIAFVRGTSVPSSIVVRPGDLFVMNADGSDERSLTGGWLDARPAWSPDGREIAFSRAKSFASSRGIWVISATGGRPRQLTQTAQSLDGAPAWSPDGTRIAFVRLTRESPNNGKAAIYMMNRDGSNLRDLLRNQLFDFFSYGLTWSPDGTSIAFETSPNRECTAISTVDVRSGVVRRLTSCERRKDSTRSPAWQPDLDTRDAS
jgi:Tol biopolymer transport system component